MLSQLAKIAPGMKKALEVATVVTLAPVVVVAGAELAGAAAVGSLGISAAARLTAAVIRSPTLSYGAGFAEGAVKGLVSGGSALPMPPAVNAQMKSGQVHGQQAARIIKSAWKIANQIPW